MSIKFVREPSYTVSVPSSGYNVSVGDLVYQTGVAGSSYAQPISGYNITGTISQAASGLMPSLLGVAMGEAFSGESSAKKLDVATEGVFLATCTALSSGYNVGSKVGLETTTPGATGGTFLNQTVTLSGVGNTTAVVGKLAAPAVSGDTTVLVRLFGNVSRNDV